MAPRSVVVVAAALEPRALVGPGAISRRPDHRPLRIPARAAAARVVRLVATRSRPAMVEAAGSRFSGLADADEKRPHHDLANLERTSRSDGRLGDWRRWRRCWWWRSGWCQSRRRQRRRGRGILPQYAGVRS